MIHTTGNYTYWLQQNDLADIARLEYQYGTDHADTLFDIVGSPQQLSVQLEQFQVKVSQAKETRPLTLIVNLGNIHWVTLVIAYQTKQFFGYYVDSLGKEILHDTRQALEQAEITPIDFHNFLPTPQQHDGHNCGLWALENAADLNRMLQEKQPLGWAVSQLKRPRDDAHFKKRRQYFAEQLRADEAGQAHQPVREPSRPLSLHPRIVGDNRPSDYDYALLSQHVYGISGHKKGDYVPDDKRWKIHQVKVGKSGYFGALYINDETQQIVLAHRGPDNLKAILEAMRDIELNEISLQLEETFVFVVEAIGLVKSKQGYRLSFTGHALCAFLAELSVLYAHKEHFPDVNAVTFESPGAKESLERINSKLNPIHLEQLDIVSYVSYPNLINTCHQHIGTLYQIEPDLRNPDLVQGWHLKKAHAIEAILSLFKAAVHHAPLRHYMSDWPLGSQKEIYVKHDQLHNGMYSIIEQPMAQQEDKVKRQLSTHKDRYRKEALSSWHVVPLRHFSANMQIFLKHFYHYRQTLADLNQDFSQQFEAKCRELKIPEQMTKYLLHYHIKAVSGGVERLELDSKELDEVAAHAFRYTVSMGLATQGSTIAKLAQSFSLPEVTPSDIQSAYQFSMKTMTALLGSEHELMSSVVLENHKVIDTHVQLPQGTDEAALRHFEQWIKTLLPEKGKGHTININVAGVSGEWNFIQGNVNATGIELNLPPTPAEHLPDQWRVPPRNPNFVGRDDLLKHVEANFKQGDQPVILTACHGLGGIGKTQVALEFVWRYYEEKKNDNNYRGICWFNAESKGRLQEEYIRLGQELHILREEEKASAEEQARYVKQWLQHPSRSGWLLVYDNALQYGGEEGIGELIPAKKGKILVTSRRATGWPQDSIRVDVFTLQESKDYLHKILGSQLLELDKAQIDQLAETLGHLPLALAQAGAYIKTNQLSIRRYLELYETRKRELLADKTLSEETLPPDSKRAIVYITWDITMDKIRIESPLGANWLNSCVYLASSDIPDFLFEAFAKVPENNPTSQIYEEARGILSSYSMLTINKQSHSASIHRLVQEVIQLKWEMEEKIKAFFATGPLLESSFPYNQKSLEAYARKRQLLPHLEAFWLHLETWQQELSALFPPLGQAMEKRFLYRFLYWMTDAYIDLEDAQKQRELLERALVIAERYYGPHHPQVARTLTSLGNAYGALGDVQKKRDLIEQALVIAERYYGPDDIDVASILGNLGNAYGALGEALKHRDLIEQALIIIERHYGSDHPEVARTLVNLGEAYGTLGDTQKKYDLLERALVILERHYGPDHPQVARTLVNLGRANRALGDPQKERDLLERALIIIERHYGPDHPEVASTLASLGTTYGVLGNPQKERDLLERALVINERHYGPDHPEVASTLESLGTTYGILGDTHKNRDLLKRALAIIERHYGPEHLEVVSCLTSLGAAYVILGQAEKALELLERASAIEERHYDPDYPKVASTLTNLSAVYGDLGDVQKQRNLLERALPLLERQYGQDHPKLAPTLTNLGSAYVKLGQAEKARELLELALAIEEKHYGPDHPMVASTLGNLGGAYMTLDQTEKACELFERVLTIEESHYGPHHHRVAKILGNLSAAYVKLGKAEQARKLLEQALPLLEEQCGFDHPQVARTLTNLGAAYEKLDQTEKARELLERALTIKENYYGSDHPELAPTLGNLGAVYVKLDQAEQARNLIERALPLLEEQYGSDHSEVVFALGNLGNAYVKLDQSEKARELLERVLTIKERHYGPDHSDLTPTLANLGLAYLALGQVEKACVLFERALTILERHYPDHPQMVTVRNQLMTLRTMVRESNIVASNFHRAQDWQTLEDETCHKNYEYSLQESDMVDIARIEYGYTRDRNNLIFTIVASPDQFNKLLKDFEKKIRQENEQRSLTFVINQGQGHWVTLIVTYQNSQLYAFYCDSLGNGLPSDIKNTLISVIPDDHIQDVHVKQQEAVYNSGLMALENAHTINQLTQAVFLSLSSSDFLVGKRLPQAVKQELFNQIRKESSQYQPTLEAMKKKRDDFATKLFNDEKRTQLKALLYAIERNNLEGVQRALNKVTDIDAVLNGYTPLHLAVKKGNLSLVLNLLAQGAIFNTVVYQEGNKTPLDMAIHYKHPDIIELLNSVNYLFKAIEDGHHQKVVADLSHVKDSDKIVAMTNSYERGGRTLLHYATQKGCLEVVECLLQQKVKVNTVAKNKSLWTPLHYAAKLNYLPIIQALLKRGAFYTPQDNQGRTPRQLTTDSTILSVLEATDKLFQAVKEDSLTELMSALDQGAEINAHDSQERTVLHVAARRGYAEIVKALLQRRSIDINARDDHQWTPLHLAARKSQLAVVQLLLEKGADVLARNDHDTVLHQAISGNDVAIIRLILEAIQEKSANDPQMLYLHKNAQDTEGDTPLMWAAEKGKVEAAQILLNYGVDINAKNKEGLTALDWTIQTNHVDVAIVLLEHKDIKLNVDERGEIINYLLPTTNYFP